MAKNNWLIPGLIAFGLISLALSFFIASQTEKQKPGQHVLARLERNLGKVSIIRKNMTSKETLSRRTLLFPLDSVETGADGDATLDFDSADRLHIQENSLVTLDEEDGHIVVIIKNGDIQVENNGNSGQVLISREGSRWTPRDYEDKVKKEANYESMPEVAPQVQSRAEARRESLSPEFIQDTLKTYRNNFFKCYTQLLQKTPGVAGQASISFTIERSGKVSNAEIASSSLADSDFKKCLIEAIRRVEFKAFSDEPISTVFPLKFE